MDQKQKTKKAPNLPVTPIYPFVPNSWVQHSGSGSVSLSINALSGNAKSTVLPGPFSAVHFPVYTFSWRMELI